MDALAKLGIDYWSILLYLINTGVLVVALTVLLYKPLLKFLDERRSTIANSIKEAEELKFAFETRLKEMELEKETLQRDITLKMQEVTTLLKNKEATLVEEMNLVRTRLLEETHAQLEQEKARLLKDAEKQTIELVQKVVHYVVQNKVPAEVVRESVQDAWKMYRS